MALGFTDVVRTALAAALIVELEKGAGAAQLNIYDNTGTRPASADDVVGTSVLLSELPLGDPSFAAGAAGVITATLPPSSTTSASMRVR